MLVFCEAIKRIVSKNILLIGNQLSGSKKVFKRLNKHKSLLFELNKDLF